MAEHKVSVHWKRTIDDFAYEAYTRDHTWVFEGGIEVPASAAPAFRGNPMRVDPEEAFVAALSSCHMLSLLAIASRKHFRLDSYDDDAVGHLEKNAAGKLVVTRVYLRPRIKFSGERIPTLEQIEKLHHQAHEECFIANSVKTEVICQPHPE
jgi:organic hydroperoxide reductase OsmC/OhrA